MICRRLLVNVHRKSASSDRLQSSTDAVCRGSRADRTQMRMGPDTEASDPIRVQTVSRPFGWLASLEGDGSALGLQGRLGLLGIFLLGVLDDDLRSRLDEILGLLEAQASTAGKYFELKETFSVRKKIVPASDHGNLKEAYQAMKDFGSRYYRAAN